MDYKSFSRRGKREINEDCVSVSDIDGSYCFTLCDGLGGHGRGEVASRLVCKAFSKLFLKYRFDSAEDFFNEAFDRSHQKLLRRQKESAATFQMRTTVVSLYIGDGECRWAHMGDSRLYAFSGEKIQLRTQDRSVPQMLALTNDIKEKDIRKHPDRNKLLRALGSDEKSPNFTLSQSYSIDTFNAFLLCSDGFWEYIDERKMQSTLKKSKSADEWVSRMRKSVIKNGEGENMDNFSAIAIIL